MTLGVTGVVWLPRTAAVNSVSLLAGAGPAPLVAAAGAWTSIAASYTDASITIGRVMAVLAAGWEGEAANAAQARLGGFFAWAEGSAAKATQVAGLAAGEAAAYATAALVMPNPAEVAVVESAKAVAYSTGGALNGSAEALEATARLLDIRAGLVMEAYEAATTPLAMKVTFDHPPRIVNDGSQSTSTGGSSSAGGSIANTTSYKETGVFGFSAKTSPAQAAVAAASAALQNPAIGGAVSQVASTAGSVAGTSVTTVASAATNIGSSAASTLFRSGTTPEGSASAGVRTDQSAPSSAATRSVSAGSMSAANGIGGMGGAGGLGGSSSGSGKLGGSVAGSAGLAQQAGTERGVAGLGGPGSFSAGNADGASTARGGHGGAPMGGSQNAGEDEEHETPGYLKQFEHFSDGRTVAPSVIGADPTWNER